MITRQASVFTAAIVAAVLSTPGHLVAQAPAAGGELDPRVEKIVASISAERLQQLLQKLSSFRTRNTLSDPNARDGIGAARQWVLDEMKRSSPRRRNIDDFVFGVAAVDAAGHESSVSAYVMAPRNDGR